MLPVALVRHRILLSLVQLVLLSHSPSKGLGQRKLVRRSHRMAQATDSLPPPAVPIAPRPCPRIGSTPRQMGSSIA